MGLRVHQVVLQYLCQKVMLDRWIHRCLYTVYSLIVFLVGSWLNGLFDGNFSTHRSDSHTIMYILQGNQSGICLSCLIGQYI